MQMEKGGSYYEFWYNTNGEAHDSSLSGRISASSFKNRKKENLVTNQQQSGKWELQIPEDPVARQSHRWPIGFVKTGFVRGSTKPVAEAFCEAALLARLRGEQWSEMQEKGRPEIFVLVRNLRSAAYRLALATIVVEQQVEDMEFMRKLLIWRKLCFKQ
ncbi:ribonucleases P/MRP protein subunit POP1-like isoform X3 [Magnolia sinica]|uniref:ribonucleases P/MRP protein subunit POP1-like isoform X3 n=1 Tax=Magnolia sinica TaxID=86752 RepID=UPI00265A2CC1|nr:ribonucleases P/MRP protein subunit POP1-like isoform X3 [Magnolia sinica]